MDPNGNHNDPDCNPEEDPDFNLEEDDFVVVPVIPINEVEEDEQLDRYGGDNEDNNEDENEEEEEEEEEDPEEDPEDNFWVAHPAQENEDDALPDMNWHEVFNPAPFPFAVFEMPKNWNEGAVPLEDDQPVVFNDLFSQDPMQLSQLIRMEMELAATTEECDRMLQQHSKDWDQITSLQMKIAQLQAEIQEAQTDQKQARKLLSTEIVKTEITEDQISRMGAAIFDFCAIIQEEICLAHKEKDLTDPEFDRYVHTLKEKRYAHHVSGPQPERQDMVPGEGASRTRED